ncbi:hypothetical protein vseg_020903 [Gypsophila vaccaria]
MEQVNAFQSYRQKQHSNYYNEGAKNHPSFSYRSNYVLIPTAPPPQQSQTYVPPPFRNNEAVCGYSHGSNPKFQRPPPVA